MNELTNFICPLSETPSSQFSFKRLTDRAQGVICLIFLQRFVFQLLCGLPGIARGVFGGRFSQLWFFRARSINKRLSDATPSEAA